MARIHRIRSRVGPFHAPAHLDSLEKAEPPARSVRPETRSKDETTESKNK